LVGRTLPSYPSIRKMLRRPFKSRAFLHTLLSLLQDTVTREGPTSATEEGRNGFTPTPTLPPPHPARTLSIAPTAPYAAASPDASPSHGSRGGEAFAPLGAALQPSGNGNGNGNGGGVSNSRPPKIRNISAQYPLRLLLAEDNLVNQRLMVMLLRKLGYELLVAVNGREVLEVMEREAARGRQHEVQCILMDASMDVMDGIECTRVIRAQQLPTRVAPFIIAQTANVTEEYRSKCLDAGMNLFLTKPVHVENLVTALKMAHAALQEQQKQQQHMTPNGADVHATNGVEATAVAAGSTAAVAHT